MDTWSSSLHVESHIPLLLVLFLAELNMTVIQLEMEYSKKKNISDHHIVLNYWEPVSAAASSFEHAA